jgi:hypothetical protein
VVGQSRDDALTAVHRREAIIPSCITPILQRVPSVGRL